MRGTTETLGWGLRARSLAGHGAVAAAAVAVVTTLAASTSAWAESPRGNMLEVQAGPYTPAVDSSFTAATPYADSFGSDSLWSFGLYMDFQLWQEVGTLAVGAGARYGWVDGHAVEEESSDETALNIAPFTLGITYRFDYLQQRVGIPLVPYVHAGLEWAIWWVTNGKNEISNARAAAAPFEGRTALSNTFGFYAGGGLQLQLDFFSQSMAAEFDSESGINNSYLFVDFTRHELNDFYSSGSIDLSDSALSFGLMFEF